MKTLYFVRHGKATDALDDKKRELTEIGVKRIHKLGKHLSQQETKLQKILSSSAVRAMQTAHIIAEYIQYPKEKIVTVKKLYTGTAQDYITAILSLPDDVDTAMMVGHNFAVTEMVHLFLPDYTSYMQTGACFCIDFEIEAWENIFTSERQMRFYVRFQ